MAILNRAKGRGEIHFSEGRLVRLSQDQKLPGDAAV